MTTTQKTQAQPNSELRSELSRLLDYRYGWSRARTRSADKAAAAIFAEFERRGLNGEGVAR